MASIGGVDTSIFDSLEERGLSERRASRGSTNAPEVGTGTMNIFFPIQIASQF